MRILQSNLSLGLANEKSLCQFLRLHRSSLFWWLLTLNHLTEQEVYVNINASSSIALLINFELLKKIQYQLFSCDKSCGL